jgi:hypothetical protein
MNSLKFIAMMATALLLAGTVAAADEITIKHRSGKIRTIQIDDNLDPVEQVSFKKSERTAVDGVKPNETITAPPPSGSTAPPPKQPAQDAKPQEKPSATPNLKIKWAAPVDSM